MTSFDNAFLRYFFCFLAKKSNVLTNNFKYKTLTKNTKLFQHVCHIRAVLQLKNKIHHLKTFIKQTLCHFFLQLHVKGSSKSRIPGMTNDASKSYYSLIYSKVPESPNGQSAEGSSPFRNRTGLLL